jgi:hypothetical protein
LPLPGDEELPDVAAGLALPEHPAVTIASAVIPTAMTDTVRREPTTGLPCVLNNVAMTLTDASDRSEVA